MFSHSFKMKVNCFPDQLFHLVESPAIPGREDLERRLPNRLWIFRRSLNTSLDLCRPSRGSALFSYLPSAPALTPCWTAGALACDHFTAASDSALLYLMALLAGAMQPESQPAPALPELPSVKLQPANSEAKQRALPY